MKGLSVLFTILLFLLAGKLSHQLKRAGVLPKQAHGDAETTLNEPLAGTASVHSTFARYPLFPQHRYD